MDMELTVQDTQDRRNSTTASRAAGAGRDAE
jgi:hypothetical protein